MAIKTWWEALQLLILFWERIPLEVIWFGWFTQNYLNLRNDLRISDFWGLVSVHECCARDVVGIPLSPRWTWMDSTFLWKYRFKYCFLNKLHTVFSLFLLYLNSLQFCQQIRVTLTKNTSMTIPLKNTLVYLSQLGLATSRDIPWNQHFH